MLSADMFGMPEASSAGGDAPVSAPAGGGGDDGFGDFGGFDPAPAPPPSAPAMPSGGGMLSADLPSLSAAAADMDDSFGQFTAITPASVLPSQAASPAPFLSPPGGAAAAAAAAAAEDGGGLQATLKSLIEQERFEEASACKAHIEAIAQLSVQMIAYERAKEEDDLETAIHLKKVVLPSLRDKKQPEHVVAVEPSPDFARALNEIIDGGIQHANIQQRGRARTCVRHARRLGRRRGVCADSRRER